MPLATHESIPKNTQRSEHAESGTYETGSPYADKGAVCERANAPTHRCVLRAGQRAAIIADINRYVGLAATSYHAALQNARIDSLLEKPKAAPLVATLLVDLLSTAFSMGLTYVIGKAVHHAAVKGMWEHGERFDLEQVTNAQKESFKSLVGIAVSAAKERVKLRFVGNNPANRSKVFFLTQLQAAVAPTFNEIAENAFNHGDDVDLLATRELLDPAYSSVTYFSSHIDGALNRFVEQGINRIGRHKVGAVDNGTCQLVRFVAHGRARFAIVVFQKGASMGRIFDERATLDKGPRFEHWVDPDLESAAVALQQATFGTISILDVSNGTGEFGPEVRAWADQARKEVQP